MPYLFRNSAVRLSCSEIWSLAAMRWARFLTNLLMMLWWVLPGTAQVQIGCCLRLVHLAAISVSLPSSAHLSAISSKNSLLCDLILTKRIKSPSLILFRKPAEFLVTSDVSVQECFDGWICFFPNPFLGCHQETFGIREQDKWSLTLRVSYCIFEGDCWCSALYEDAPSSSFPLCRNLPLPLMSVKVCPHIPFLLRAIDSVDQAQE